MKIAILLIDPNSNNDKANKVMAVINPQKVDHKNTCYVFLSMLYLTFMSASLLLSYRFVNIAGVLTVGSVFVIPITYAISDIISELYGYSAMRATIWKMLSCLFILSLLLDGLVHLPVSSKYQLYTQHYHFIFDPHAANLFF